MFTIKSRWQTAERSVSNFLFASLQKVQEGDDVTIIVLNRPGVYLDNAQDLVRESVKAGERIIVCLMPRDVDPRALDTIEKELADLGALPENYGGSVHVSQLQYQEAEDGFQDLGGPELLRALQTLGYPLL